MTITETPFLQFWRALNAELDKLGEPPATAGQANRMAKYVSAKTAAAMLFWFRAYDRPTHARNAAKDLTP